MLWIMHVGKGEFTASKSQRPTRIGGTTDLVIHSYHYKKICLCYYMWYCSVGVVAQISNTYVTYILNMCYMCPTCGTYVAYMLHMFYMCDTCSVGVVAEISNTYVTYILNMCYMCHTCRTYVAYMLHMFYMCVTCRTYLVYMQHMCLKFQLQPLHYSITYKINICFL